MVTKFETKEEVHNKAIKIVGKRFGELSNLLEIKQTKSSVGDLFEAWFDKMKDSDSKPDLGVAELKATPYKQLKNRDYSAKERLVLNIINYMDIVTESFEDSHFIYKNKVIELAFYEYVKEIPQTDWYFSYVVLYEMMKNPKDFAVIKKDWQIIQQCVADGNAENLSESMTNYLSACTKGKSAKTVRPQPFSDVKAKQRAFSFKSSYMTQLFRRYVIGDESSESIIKDSIELQTKSLEDIINSRFEPFIGRKTEQLSDELNVSITAKNSNNLLIRAMLGLNIATNKDVNSDVEEFNKASYLIKTVQFDSEGVNKESMSFPTFKFNDLVNETWVDEDGSPEANLNVLLSESTFVFVVFQRDSKGDNFFKGIKLFNMPQSDIDGDVKTVWEDTVNKLKNGVRLKYDGRRVTNNFIKKNNHMIIHVRPHAQKASYTNTINSDELPTPAQWENKPTDYSNEYMTKQCFFLNNNYIKQVVQDILV